MTSFRSPIRYAAALTVALVAGCSGSTPVAVSTSTRTVPAASTGSAASTASASPSTSTSAAPATTTAAPASCVDTTYAALTPKQRRGQLLMVGLGAGAPASSLATTISASKVGNIILLGGWTGSASVRTATRGVSDLVAAAADGVRPLVSADQEGGVVHQLRGDGFTRPPSALDQAGLGKAALTTAATGWARELKAAGVNVNLAPVADTVPTSIGRANGPIGRWAREYGSTPQKVTPAVEAFVAGMRAGGVEATVKHFPGLGRIRGNTDFTTAGISDSTTTATDPYLKPFRAGIAAGAGLVMVGSARYPKIDPAHPDTPAMFSSAVVTDLLRGRLQWDGVVITDDVNAVAVKSVPAGQRAVRFVDAGGDIVLSGDPAVAGLMATAMAQREASDAAYAAKTAAAVKRVLALKDRMGLLTCS